MSYVMPGTFIPDNEGNSNSSGNSSSSRTPLLWTNPTATYQSTSPILTDPQLIPLDQICNIVPQKANVMKSRNKLRTQCITNLHSLILLQIVVVYLIDCSLLKLLVKTLLQFLLLSFSQDDVSQVVEMLLNQQQNGNGNGNGNESTGGGGQGGTESVHQTLRKMSKGIAGFFVLINLITVLDHVFAFDGLSTIVPHYLTDDGLFIQIRHLISAESTHNSTADGVGDGDGESKWWIITLISIFFKVASRKTIRWLNDNVNDTISRYENASNFQYSAVFINFIGELKISTKLPLIVLDLVIVLLQYLMYMIALHNPKNASPVDEPQPQQQQQRARSRIGYGSGLFGNSDNQYDGDDQYDDDDDDDGSVYEDGYQGTISVIEINLTPEIRFQLIKDNFLRFIQG
ncbi:unnamed protein product [Ambrosiozyma monospora]|uniref:Unnamed protein product n=1 Tax=Ambrosiozyma monospora TaxID=43982 RepID=A0A9W7DBI3_AMBMO|nr:unnamed protein product [Ambrosiozyma monospora]